MSLLIATLRRVIGDLNEIGRGWALAGGLAVSARAEPRTTRDIDVVLVVEDDADAEAVVFAFQQLGYVLESALEHTVTRRLATARLRPPERGVLVDLMFASSGIEDEIVHEATRLEILRGMHIPVATTAHLIAMKVLARDDRDRPQDWDDLRALLREATAEDIQHARGALALIERRGFHRARDLQSSLDRVLEEVTAADRSLRPR